MITGDVGVSLKSKALRASSDTFKTKGLSHKSAVSSTLSYTRNKSQYSLVTRYRLSDNSYLNYHNKDEKLELRKASLELELEFAPNVEKCHRYGFGVKQIEVGLGFAQKGREFDELEFYHEFA